jgi:hypothetical protein
MGDISVAVDENCFVNSGYVASIAMLQFWSGGPHANLTVELQIGKEGRRGRVRMHNCGAWQPR